MRLEFIGINEDSSWWGDIKYEFYIIYEDKEDIDKFEKEFKLNCKHQLQ